MSEVVTFLKQTDKPGMAIYVRELYEENVQLKRDLEYETWRRKFAEKEYLREVDKSWFQKLFS